MHVAMLLFDRLTQLDLTGPYEVFHRMPDTAVQLVAKTRDAVRAEGGLAILPDAAFAEATACDLLFVPGGVGVNAAMLDDETIAFVRRQAGHARWITSVCTGALILGAAGLLRGYRATTHWSAIDYLPCFGAMPVRGERVVIDRNRVTGGGVTAGIDFALTIARELHGETVAKSIQLAIEYNPRPPFDAGSPEVADAATLALVRERVARNAPARAAAVEAAAARMPE
jgi:cyclohexyl-isocyanide hydratase